jgi:hypothetical protein
LANFGLKVGVVGAVKFEERIRELIADMPDLAEIMAGCLMPGAGCASTLPLFTASSWSSHAGMMCAGD